MGLSNGELRRLVADFKRGLSAIGLARKYAMPVVRVESLLRRALYARLRRARKSVDRRTREIVAERRKRVKAGGTWV